MKRTKRTLMTSILALVLCFSMLVGSTFAWFTDISTSKGNVIQSGKLDAEMYWSDTLLAADSTEWKNADGVPVFTYDNWEPGYTEVKYVKIRNAGNLSFKWLLSIEPEGEVGKLAEVIDVYYVNPVENELTTLDGQQSAGVLADVIKNHTATSGVILPQGQTSTEHKVYETIIAIAFHMQEDAGNDYQTESVGDGFSLKLFATQFGLESDAFGNDYDTEAEWPDNVTVGNSATADVSTTNNLLNSEASMTSTDGKISATAPTGVKVDDNVDKLTLTVTEVENSKANITLDENEATLSVDVHIDGVAEDNDVVIKVHIKELLPVGLNMGNYRFYHVENGATVEMHLLAAGETPVHNNYEYDPATGDVTLYLKSFSEVALVSETEGAWKGNRDYSWYDANATEYIIANADQLAAFGAIVGGMAKDGEGNFLITYKDGDGDEHHNDFFEGKTVKLVADINLGDKESENNPNLIFYPIGYWNSDGVYEKTGTAISSGFYAFKGTFDGNGNTISNFYQNTWEMKGDHDWYDATLQYYRDGMGLFGKILGGTVKNLTVENFSCDSEIGTSGVIAAYADSMDGKPATFENIAIINCNPRVYNIGNGGIVGCAGWYSRNEDLSDGDYANAVVFRNITVDQSNKISALWGSWGVSCAGILGQYYPNSNCGIKLENCHVAAIIDVNNDVCSNYQYYWYRYAGMFIGTIRANTTDKDGYTVADTTGVTAKDCTYTMGDWNEYWYCEIVQNSLASYTHDHQFSRLDNIYDLSEISNDGGVTWEKEGHFALLDENRDIVDCYHIFKNSEGKLYRHFHDVADESNPNIYESFDLNGDGELNDLKEDRQRYFIPFNQLLTGLDMGIKAHTEFDGITFVENGTVKSEEKFESLGIVTTYRPGQTITLGQLFSSIVDETKLSKVTIYAAVSPATENDSVSATYSLDLSDWRNSTITFAEDCEGSAKIVITDYFYCTPTVIYLDPEEAAEKFTANNGVAQSAYTQITLGALFGVEGGATIGNVTATVTDPDGNETTVTGTSSDWTTKTIDLTKEGEWTVAIKDDDAYCSVTTATFTVNKVDKFTKKFDKDFLYRVGNQNTVDVGYIFGEIETAVKLSSVNVTITNVAGNAAGEFTPNATWTKGTVQFTGTGVVTVTISADGANDLTINLEVVDAVNATAAMSATSHNVVLLCDIGNGFTVSGRYAVYGNGFTLNYTGNGQYLNNGLKQGLITVNENGTLDNLRIVASIYPVAYMYYGSNGFADAVQDGPYSTEGDRIRYHYQLSAVALSGNGTISNCYIYGGRNNIFVNTGDVTIKDTILECGVVANVQIQSNASHTITFENVTTIQHQVNPTIGDTSKVMLGAGVLVGPETTDNPTIVLNGDFKQYNWVTSDDANAVSDTKITKAIIEGALNATAYNHTVNGKTASNLGIIYMNTNDAEVTDNTGLPYAMGDVSIQVSGTSINGKVYSLQGATSEQIYSDHENADKSTVNGYYTPQFSYSPDLGGQYVAEGGDEHCYREGDTIYVMFPISDAVTTLDISKLVDIQKYSGQDLNFQCFCTNPMGMMVAAPQGKLDISNAGNYTLTYEVTDTLFYNENGETVEKTVVYTWDVTVSVSLKDVSVPNAEFEFDSTKQIMGYAKKSVLSGGNTQYLPFLAGLKIYDYNYGSETPYLRFDGDTDFNKIASAEITGYTSANHVLIKVTLTDGGVITIDTTARAVSGGSTYTGALQTSGNTLYYVNGGTTSATTTTWVISNYSFIGNNGVAVDSGSVTFADCEKGSSVPSSSFATKINHTVSYDANGGKCGQTVSHSTSVSSAVTLPTPTRSGYIFLGWYTAASGGTKVGGAGDSYTPSANITLYAQWITPFNVIYNANGGSCDTTSAYYDGTALTLPTATRDGYWFIGWYDAATGGNKIGDAGVAYNPLAEITLYAHWQEQIEYIVTYNANGGTCGTASATYEGTALTLPTPDDRTGYTFLGWFDGTKTYSAGDSYTPSENITLYAQWQINSYTIKVTTNNATVKVNGTAVSNNGTVSVPYGAQVTVEVTYSESDSQSTTIKGTDGTTYSSPFNMPAQDVTINATSSGCVTPDTLITLADGTQVRVDSLTGNEELLVWNMETGKLDKAPIMFVDSDAEAEFEVIKLYFSDGTEVKVIYEHGFWDYDLNKYVYLDRNAADYIGHTFAKQNGDSLEKVELIDVVIETEVTTAWSPVTAGHLCYFVNGMLSMPGGVGGLFNIFEVDPETMTYDFEAMQKDIETYGLYTYEELNAICPLSEEMFNAAGGAYLKISIGKGNLTIDELIYMINRYSKFI